MALVPIPIGKGSFSNVDAIELASSEYGVVFKNLLLTDSGSSTDRPGLDEFAVAGSFPVLGLAFWNNFVVAVSTARRIYKVTSAGVVTDITGAAALEGSARPVFANDGTYLAIAGGGSPRRWSGTGDTELMPGSPPDCTHIKYVDGYWVLFLTDDSEFRFAGPTSATREVWNTADFFSAEGGPGNVVAEELLLKELYAFKNTSIQAFRNYGDSSTPIVPSFFIDKGTESPYSILNVENTLWFLDSDRNFVCMPSQSMPTPISTPFKRVIQAFETVSDCFAWQAEVGPHSLIVWTFPTEERSFAYDYLKKEWSEFDGYVNSQSNRLRVNAHVFAKGWRKHIVGDYRNGQLLELSLDYKSDGEEPLKRIRRTGFIDHGTGSRKRNNFYRLKLKRGLGTSGGIEPVMLMRFRDDNAAWSDPIEVGLGFEGDNDPTYHVYSTGIYRRRQIEFSMTDEVEFLLVSLEEDATVLAS